jgi:hypothetical protein
MKEAHTTNAFVGSKRLLDGVRQTHIGGKVGDHEGNVDALVLQGACDEPCLNLGTAVLRPGRGVEEGESSLNDANLHLRPSILYTAAYGLISMLAPFSALRRPWLEIRRIEQDHLFDISSARPRSRDGDRARARRHDCRGVRAATKLSTTLERVV